MSMAPLAWLTLIGPPFVTILILRLSNEPDPLSSKSSIPVRLRIDIFRISLAEVLSSLMCQDGLVLTVVVVASELTEELPEAGCETLFDDSSDAETALTLA